MYDHSSSSDNFSSNEKSEDDTEFLSKQLEKFCEFKRSRKGHGYGFPWVRVRVTILMTRNG